MSKPKLEIILPTAGEIPALVDRCKELDTQIEALSTERDAIQARLKAYAVQHSELHEPLKDDRREGRKVHVTGAARGGLNIVIASDLIIGSFPDGGKKHKELISVLCEVHSEAEAPSILARFFEAPSKWENKYDNGLKFRAAVAEHLAPKIATKFVSACTQVDKFGVKKNTISIDHPKAAKVDGKAES